MKKSDSATGMIIEVPETMLMKSRFPFPGFWTGAYPQLLSAMMARDSLRNANRQLVSSALDTCIGLVNGEYSIFLTEKLWANGELMNLNPLLPIEGRVGPLGYIKGGTDGGRMEVAAALFEPAVVAIINTMSNKMATTNDLVSFSGDLTSLRAEQIRLNNRLAELEATTPSEADVTNAGRACTQLENALNVCVNERDQIAYTLNNLRNSAGARRGIENEFKQLSNQVAAMQLRLSSLTNQERVHYAKAKQRMENIGLSLQRGQYGGDPAMEGDYKALLSFKEKECKQIESNLNQCRMEYSRTERAYSDGIEEGRKVWSKIKELNGQIVDIQGSIGKARDNMSSLNMETERDLVKVWASHLSSARAAIEGAFFEAKYSATKALGSRPASMLVDALPVDPSVIRDYEDFNSALTDIADDITDEEYDIVEQIGRLGLAMMYVPGAARVLALAGMDRDERLNAYRVMTEEILSQGQRMPSDSKKLLSKFGIGDYGITFESGSELKEMKNLLRHLADSRLNFKYGGNA